MACLVKVKTDTVSGHLSCLLNFQFMVLLGLRREDGQNGTTCILSIECPSILLCGIDSTLQMLETIRVTCSLECWSYAGNPGKRYLEEVARSIYTNTYDKLQIKSSGEYFEYCYCPSHASWCLCRYHDVQQMLTFNKALFPPMSTHDITQAVCTSMHLTYVIQLVRNLSGKVTCILGDHTGVTLFPGPVP